MKKEFTEGPEAKGQFERAMTALFKVPKAAVARTIKKKSKKGKG